MPAFWVTAVSQMSCKSAYTEKTGRKAKGLHKQQSAGPDEVSPAGVRWGALRVDLHPGITGSMQGPLKDRLNHLCGENGFQKCVNPEWDSLPALPTTLPARVSLIQTIHLVSTGCEKQEKEVAEAKCPLLCFFFPSQSQTIGKAVTAAPLYYCSPLPHSVPSRVFCCCCCCCLVFLTSQIRSYERLFSAL